MKKTTSVKTESVASKPRFGVFDHRALDGTVHAVQVDENNVPVSPHVLKEDCVCYPDVEHYDHLFINHKEIK